MYTLLNAVFNLISTLLIGLFKSLNTGFSKSVILIYSIAVRTTYTITTDTIKCSTNLYEFTYEPFGKTSFQSHFLT